MKEIVKLEAYNIEQLVNLSGVKDENLEVLEDHFQEEFLWFLSRLDLRTWSGVFPYFQLLFKLHQFIVIDSGSEYVIIKLPAF